MVFLFFLGGVAQLSYTHSFSDITAYHKVALFYKVNDFKVYVDGTQVHTDTSGSVYSKGTLDSLQYTSGASSEPFYGKCKDLRVYDTEGLSDTEITNLLTEITS